MVGYTGQRPTPTVMVQTESHICVGSASVECLKNLHPDQHHTIVQPRRETRLRLAEFAKHRIDRIECRVNLLTDLARAMSHIVIVARKSRYAHLCTSQDDLARDED